MRFVVATLPDVDFPLGRDVVLAKSSALYADETMVFSPTYSGTEPYVDFQDRPLLHQLFWLAILRRDPGFVVGEKLTPAQRKKRIKNAKDASDTLFEKARRWVDIIQSEPNLSAELREERSYIEAETKAVAQHVNEVFSDDNDLVQRSRELKNGEKLGLIRLQQINDTPNLYFSQKKLVSDVTNALSASDTYWALDERFIVPFKKSPQGQVLKQKVAQVAEEMFRRLPVFEEASFDEIRDIKRELEKYLANFRRGLLEISQEVRSQPWDKDFPNEVERELRIRVLPEVVAIEDKVKSNSYLRQLLHKVAKEPLILPASSALGMVLSTSFHASPIASQIASAFAGSGLLALEAYKKWNEEKRKAEENLFFFYYKAGKLLAKRTHR